METITEGPDSTPTPAEVAVPDIADLAALDPGPSEPPPISGDPAPAADEGLDAGLGAGLAIGLELDTPPPSKPKPKRSADPSGDAKASASLGIFDDDADEGGALDVGLDLGSIPPKGPAPMRRPEAPPESMPKPVGAAQPPSPPEPEQGAAPAPLPSAPAVQARPPVAVDPEKVRVLADFGPYPPNIAATPLYTINVVKRRFQLKDLHKQQVTLHADTVRALRGEIADEVSKVVGAASGSAVDAIKRTLAEADNVVSERNQVMESATSAFAGRRQTLEDELDKHQETRKAAVKARDMAQIQVEDAQQQRLRADDDRRRVEAALAQAEDAARDAAGTSAQFAPPEHAKRIAELQQKQAQAARVLAEGDAKLAEARRHLRERERGIKSTDDAIAGVHRQNASLEKEASQTHGASIEALKQAQVYRLDCYENALQQLESQGSVDEAARGRIVAVRERIKEQDIELEAYRLALDAYDHDGFKRGLAVLSLVLLIVLLVIGTFIRIAAST